MPLVYQQNINASSKLAVWHIAEPEDFFLTKVPVHHAITHPHKRLQHLAGRLLLTELFEDFPLELIRIADTRKPYLPGEAFHFSISHCGDYAAAIASTENRVGVDIEMMSGKIEKIKNKFLSVAEHNMISRLQPGDNPALLIQWLTLAWSIKEAMFKWEGNGRIDFRKHLQIHQISRAGNMFIADCILQKENPVALKVHGLLFNGNILTWLVT
jgi:phosphopantetheinyl transferase